MTQQINPKFADILDMDMPEEPVDDQPMITVDAHEITVVDNPDLPDMTDIDSRLIEGEKQLEVIISKGISMTQELYEELSSIEPKYRNRHMEITSLVMGNTLDAIKHKTELQMKKKEMRMKEKSYGGKENSGKSGGGGTTNNFFGTREDMLKFIREAKKNEK